MKKINLKGISEIMNEKELKNVMGGSGSGSCSLKCFNYETSCWVSACPGSKADAEAMCKTANCGGSFGMYISCAC